MKPQALNVFGKTYRIEYKPLEDLDGECHNKKSLIEIDQSLTGSNFTQTLIHEGLHALFYRLGYNQVIHHDIEELLVDQIATFLVDNFTFEP